MATCPIAQGTSAPGKVRIFKGTKEVFLFPQSLFVMLVQVLLNMQSSLLCSTFKLVNQ